MPMPPQLAKARPRRRPRRLQPRTVLEELPAIDARWLARKKLLPRDHSTHRYSLDFLNPVIRWLTLSPRCAEFVLTNGTTQSVGITWLRIGGICQGARAAFECPNCGQRRFKLYYYRDHFSGCYRCVNRFGVPYASQTITPKARPILQAKRLQQFLGEVPGITTMHKPLLMHRRTYNRLLAKLRQIEARPHIRNYKNKRLSRRLLRPVSMYRTRLAQFAEN